MKYNLTPEIMLVDGENSTPVLLVRGQSFRPTDALPWPFHLAGYDVAGNHTGDSRDFCYLAGALVRTHRESLRSNFPTDVYEFIKRFA